MLPTPAISVITPTYNHEGFIGECIQSVLDQTFAFWEQLVIDDGSTDATGAVVKTFGDSRIKYIRQENQGPERLAQTYNTALKASKGEFIAILEGDDMWPADKLQKMIGEFEDPSVVLVYGDLQDVEVDGKLCPRGSRIDRLRASTPDSTLNNDPAGTLAKLILRADATDVIAPATVIVRRAALEKIGGFRGVPGLPLTDYPTFLPLTLMGRFRFVRSICGLRRRHIGSVTATRAEQIFDRVRKMAFDFMDEHSAALSLSRAERKEIVRSWELAASRLRFTQGRMLLARRQWQDARTQFRFAMRGTRTVDQFLGALGMAVSYLRIDLEWAFRAAGRPVYRGVQR